MRVRREAVKTSITVTIAMQKGLKASLIFAAMVAAPLIARAFGAQHTFAHSGSNAAQAGSDMAAWLLLMLPLAGLIFFCVVVYERLDRIATDLKLAERDFNTLISGMMEHGGRKARAVERSEWNLMATVPKIQIFQEGYRTVAHELIAANEKELQSKGAVAGRAAITAFLLRELYEGNVESAQNKVVADTRNGDGKPPYVAPGIRELIGFHRFTPEDGFRKPAGVNWVMLWLTVKLWGFPRNILMVKTNAATGEKFALRGHAVLTDMTQQQL